MYVNFQIADDSELPTVICKECLELVTTAFTLKVLLLSSQNTLQQYLEQKSQLKCNFDNILNKSSDFHEEPEASGDYYNDITPMQDVDDDAIKRAAVEVKLHPCPICTKEFTAHELRKHVHTHVGLKKYINIPTSKRVPVSKKFYERRLQNNTTIFNMSEIVHKCVFCEQVYPAADLKIHCQKHLNKEEFKCEQCGRIFRKINHLNTHRVKHLKEHPYECEKCGKGKQLNAV